jgi:hypothetical protein
VYPGNAARPLAEDPAGSGLHSGYGRGNLWSTSDYDYYSFTGQAGQLLTVAAEVPGSPASSGMFYDIRKPDGERLTYFYSDYNGRGQSTPATLPASGTYAVYARYDYDYQGEYRLRVSLADPPLQMESEANDNAANADVLAFPVAGAAQGRAIEAGYIGVSDSYDY